MAFDNGLQSLTASRRRLRFRPRSRLRLAVKRKLVNGKTWTVESPTSELKSCGFLIYRRADSGSVDAIIGKSFLLMRHADRWDLPKGHMDQGESEIETALRELDEETGIAESDIRIDRQFRFEHSYTVRLKKFRLEPRDKTLVVFLAELLNPVDLHVTEHSGYDWFSWQPPHLIQAMTIDPLLDAVARHWKTTKPETAL